MAIIDNVKIKVPTIIIALKTMRALMFMLIHMKIQSFNNSFLMKV